MSRIGKIPIRVPDKVKATISKDSVLVEGPKGKLSINLPLNIKAELKDGMLVITRSANNKQARADHGSTRAHLMNMVKGVLEGHQKELEIIGVGFRAQLQGNKVTFNLGFSHPVEFEVPKDVKVTIPKPTIVIVDGLDRAVVGLVAAKMHDLKPPEPYKGKGIRYKGEFVRRKQGKTVTK